MDKIFHYLVNGTFCVMKGPILSLLIVCVVVSLIRHPPANSLTLIESTSINQLNDHDRVISYDSSQIRTQTEDEVELCDDDQGRSNA